MSAPAPDKARALSQAAWHRLAPDPSVEVRLRRFVAAMSPDARRAFWIAALVLDGRMRIESVFDCYPSGSAPIAGPPPQPEPVEVPTRPTHCAWCGNELPPPPGPVNGRPRRYHDVCQPWRSKTYARNRPRPRPAAEGNLTGR